MDEIELKFLDINVDDVKKKLESIGAKLIYDTHIESYPFLAEGFHASDSNMKYLRVRKVDDEVTVTYKDPASESEMTSREEIEIKTDDYSQAIALIEKLGFVRGKVFKKHRVHYELGDVHFEIDTLENVEPYLEIETLSEQEMRSICDKLGLDILEGKKGTIVEILPDKFAD